MNLDITNFRRKVKEKKLSFYYAMIYASMQADNEITELKYRFHGDQVVLHNKIHPSFTDLTPGSDLFKLVTVDLKDTMEEFVAAAKEKSEHQTEYFALADLAGRDDLAYITCIPWYFISHPVFYGAIRIFSYPYRICSAVSFIPFPAYNVPESMGCFPCYYRHIIPNCITVSNTNTENKSYK
jgi:chloramphenicol O-acetyltransferase